MAKDRFGYGNEIKGETLSRKEEMEAYSKWLEPYLKRTQEQYKDIPPDRIYFQTLSDILENTNPKALIQNLNQLGITDVFNSEYNSVLDNKGRGNF